MRIPLFILAIFFISAPAWAQDVTTTPICTQIINEADYTVRGTISTASATYEGSSETVLNGTEARHTANFRIESGGRWDICSTGPFYEGQMLELTIRTLIPIFECRTALYAPIYIRSERTPDGELKTWADCL